MIKRIIDVIIALIASLVLFIPFLIVAGLVYATSKGGIFFWSDRIGRNNKIFSMPKFRSMKIGTPAVATHLLPEPDKTLTSIGSFLRKTSLDELPQLWCILKGEMSFVGPRPALFNQDDLIKLRTKNDIHLLTPGLTGWAQVNGRDDISIEDKVNYDLEYLKRRSISFDFHIIWQTFKTVISHGDVSH